MGRHEAPLDGQHPGSLSNTHQPESYQPILCADSIFFKVAPEVERIADHLPGLITSQTKDVVSRNPPELAHLSGRESTPTLILKSTLNLPDWPVKVPSPVIFACGSAESAAVTIGRYHFDSDNILTFQPARLHTGPDAQRDLAASMWQAWQHPEIISRLAGDDQTFIIYLTREGHIPQVQVPLWDHYSRIDPYTIAHVEHAPYDNPFGRVTKICPINYEGLTPAVTDLIAGDSIASGEQAVAVFELFLSRMKQLCGPDYHLRHLVLVSPLLTAYGAAVVGLSAARSGIQTTFVTSETILGCLPPDRYYSPVLAQPHLHASPEFIPLLRAALGTGFEKICVRGNWTASFAAVSHALTKSNEELAPLGLSNSFLERQCVNLTPRSVWERYRIPPERLLPYSTWYEAYRTDRLDQLKQLLTIAN